MKHLVNGTDKVQRAWFRFHRARENRLIGDVAAVVGCCVVGVLMDNIAREINAGKEALATGVSQEACVS